MDRPENHFDLAIIGGGPGGMAAALSAATRGMRVVLADGGDFLGYGLHGAYKSKALWEAAKDWLSAERLGWLCAPSARDGLLDKIHKRVREGVDYLTDMYVKYMELKEVRFVRGYASLLDSHSFQVNGQRFEADYFILASGSRPRQLAGVRVDGRRIMTSDHIVDILEDFGSLLVIGAGVLGCEFTSIFSALGIEVTLLDRADRLMSNEDEDISELLADYYRRNGVDVRSRARARSVTAAEGSVRTELEDGSMIFTDRVLLSIGRVPSSSKLNLSAVGVQTDSYGAIPVNENLQTKVPHMYAVGDVGQRNTPLDLALVQVAEAEGNMAVRHIYGATIDIHAEYVPFIIFTIPMIAGAGLNETQARQRYPGARVAKFRNVRNHRYHAMLTHEGFLKLMVGPPGDDRILGVRAIGNQADTVTGEASVLIDNKVPYTYLLESTHAHPSLAESLQNAARVIAGILPPDVDVSQTS
jgi:dihydrolipoamide dehydrogenase